MQHSHRVTFLRALPYAARSSECVKKCAGIRLDRTEKFCKLVEKLYNPQNQDETVIDMD